MSLSHFSGNENTEQVETQRDKWIFFVDILEVLISGKIIFIVKKVIIIFLTKFLE
jgi:hypothetical protein